MACWGLTFVPLDCASWLIEREEDIPITISVVLKGLFTMLTSRETPFEDTLDWLQFTYTVDQVGDYVVPAYKSPTKS